MERFRDNVATTLDRSNLTSSLMQRADINQTIVSPPLALLTPGTFFHNRLLFDSFIPSRAMPSSETFQMHFGRCYSMDFRLPSMEKIARGLREDATDEQCNDDDKEHPVRSLGAGSWSARGAAGSCGAIRCVVVSQQPEDKVHRGSHLRRGPTTARR